MNSKIYLGFDNLSAQSIEDDAELIPLLSPEDEEEMDREEVPETLPILPLRNTVLFPGVVIPITAGRDTSIALIKAANQGSKTIGVVAQRDASVEAPSVADVYEIGTVARILRVLQMPDGNTTIIIQGKKRFKLNAIVQEKPFMVASVSEMMEKKPAPNNKEFEAIVDGIKEIALKIIKINPNLPSEASFAIQNIQSGSFLINFVSSNLNLKVSEKQELLALGNLKDRALKTLQLMNVELQRLELKNDIQSKVRSDLDQQQREYFLHQQMKTIQEELGGASHEEEIEEMRQLGAKKNWPDQTAKLFDRELSKLQRMNPQVAEYAIQRNYLELFLELPWNDMAADSIEMDTARNILDRDHHGLTEVKKRILEHLAVLKLKGDMKSPILCLYGPPGVGKTSLGKSIAEAMGRPYVRMSLGGLRDEAEIRGHRKTYIGAMPGRIIQNIKKAGVSNPVFVLDEIDKLAHGAQGDPSSALLEVLDPEQNDSFYDNFLEAGYDLSKVMFIATANNIGDIPAALRDRMELIEVNGYALEEKIEIAVKHLLPKQLVDHGLKKTDLKLSKKILEKIVAQYTRESGVRNLQKQLAKIARSAAIKKASEEVYEKTYTEAIIEQVLGSPRYTTDQYETNEVAGVVTGLAWTAVGGTILFIESSLSKGKGSLSITGNLGNVMKESATIALQYLKANHELFGIKPTVFEEYNIHIHVPEGATPKDGPSAGITLLTSLVSLLTQRKVRSKLAMTGEITLRGKVLPVGGIKEKILAAKRASISDIILCAENEKDVNEIEPHYLKGLTFHYVRNMSEVIEIALLKQKVKSAKKL
ncbi:MAG: endopeptidase La [Flavobacteriaceae bacterium]